MAVGVFANPQGLNRYAYALNAPATFSDPTGFDCFDNGDCGGDSPFGPDIPYSTIDNGSSTISLNGYGLPGSSTGSIDFSTYGNDYLSGSGADGDGSSSGGWSGFVAQAGNTDPSGQCSVGQCGSGGNGMLAFVGDSAAYEIALKASRFGPLTAVALPFALSGDTCTCDYDPFYYATYTRTNPSSDKVYSGRTSGYGDPYILVAQRGAQQAILNAEGYNPPILDQALMLQQDPNAYGAIRGREQQLIDYFGGAQSYEGTSRNMINGISYYNPLRSTYIQLSIARFGALPDNSPGRPGN